MKSRRPLSQALANAALSAALDPIITIDPRGNIWSASESVHRVFGWKPSEIVGRNVSILMAEPHRSAHDGYLERYARTGATNILNTPRIFDAQRKDGSIFSIELSVSLAHAPGMTAPLFIGIIRDLTAHSSIQRHDEVERLRLQSLVTEQTTALQAAHVRLRLADRLASIGTLAAGLGHDMNSVLLPVRAHLNAIRTECAANNGSGGEEGARGRGAARATCLPRVRRYIKGLDGSVAYLQSLADGLHYLAQDPDTVEPDFSVTDLSRWWRQAGTIIVKAVPRHVNVTATFPSRLPPVAVAPHLLTQAVLNLVINAGEAIPTAARARREGRVRVWAEAGDRRDQVRLCVADNGTGMTPEVKRRAFELFFTTKTRGLGTGLGLPLVHKVASRVGGSVAIDSHLGAGTTVMMTLPVAVRSPRTSRRASKGRSAPLSAVVSVADGRLAAILCHVLEAAGCAVTMSDEPGNAQLWLTEHGNPALAVRGARKPARARPGKGRRVILLGRPVPAANPRKSAGIDWGDPDPVTIDDPGDFEAIRAAVTLALAGR